MPSALDFEGSGGERLPDDRESGARLVSVVGDWFLDFFQESPQSFWETMKYYAEGNPARGDRLCKDITSAPYIDYMRPRVDDDESLFRKIDEAAGFALSGPDFDPVAQYPHTIILMLGLGRTYLTKDTRLYELGRKSYEHYKELALAARGDGGAAAERFRSVAL